MKLLLVRHGQTEDFEKGITGGFHDTNVSKTGIKMLEKNRQNCDYPATDFYYTSPLIRTKQTMSVLFPDKVSSGEIKELKEHDMGDFENQKRNPDFSVYQAWLGDHSPYHDELFSDFQKRVVKGIECLYQRHNSDRVTVVCHAGVIRAVIMYFKDIPAKEYYTLTIPNGNGYYFDIDRENGRLVCKNIEMIGERK